MVTWWRMTCCGRELRPHLATWQQGRVCVYVDMSCVLAVACSCIKLLHICCSVPLAMRPVLPSILHYRLAIVPMSQEARGLDAGQRLATRLVGAGDNRSASIVKRIAEEERAHVAVGRCGIGWLGG